MTAEPRFSMLTSIRPRSPALRRLQGQLGDPTLESAAHLALSWVLPISDREGALRAATTALAGLRERNEPLRGWASLTVGLLQMSLGRDDVARAALGEAAVLGGQLGNHWLQSAARTQLASLAVKAGHPDQAQALLVASLETAVDSEPGTQVLSFALVAYARLARGPAGLAHHARRRRPGARPGGEGDRARRVPAGVGCRNEARSAGVRGAGAGLR